MEVDDDEKLLAKLYSRGQKREAIDDLVNEQRLAKRLNCLNLHHDDGTSDISVPLHRKRANAFSDTMSVDDTRDKIYISNLEEEIQDAEDEEEKLIFLPDIERKLNKIPTWVLTGEPAPPPGNQVVLYGIPESLSVSKEQDNVRKAMLESRSRAREMRANGIEHEDEKRLNTWNNSYTPIDRRFGKLPQSHMEQMPSISSDGDVVME